MTLHVRNLVLAVGLAAAAGTLGGCQTVKETYADAFYSGTVLTYEQYLSIDQTANPAPTADEVMEALGNPSSVKDRDGVKRRVEYWAFSLTGEIKRAEFHFNEFGRLEKKELW